MKKFSIERPDFLNLDFDTKKTGKINESLNLSKFEKEAEKDSDLFTEFEVEAKSLNEEVEEPIEECGNKPIEECGNNPVTEGKTCPNCHWEVQYLDGTVESYTDREEVSELVDALEAFERDDVNRIDLVDENGEFIDDVWTVEEGIMNDDSLYEGCNNYKTKKLGRPANKPALTEDTYLSQEEFDQLRNDPLTKKFESIIADFFTDEGVEIGDDFLTDDDVDIHPAYINAIAAKLAHVVKTHVADYKKVEADKKR